MSPRKKTTKTPNESAQEKADTGEVEKKSPSANKIDETTPDTGNKSNKSEEPVFLLSRFETLCYSRQHEPAAREFISLLRMLDRNYGAFDQGFVAKPTADLRGVDQDPHIINRICSAISALFSDSEFNLSIQGFRQILFMHRWIATLFAASSFRNADHILRALNLNGPEASDVQIASKNMIKFCLLFTPNSEIPLNMDALWNFDKNLAAALSCALLSPRFLGTLSAHHKRNILLNWLPPRLDEIEDLDVLPVGVLHDVYMHCSYADLASKHAIKAPINRLVRKKLLQQGITDINLIPKKLKKGEKPVMMVLLEWFSGGHSIYRTHSKSIIAAREQFKVIGVGHHGQIDDKGKAVFDEYIEVKGETVSFIRELANKIRPDLIYYPAFGMFPHSIFLTNIRMAPIQVVSYGHPATSQSPFIDYFVLPEDWVGDPACFSEKLLPLPAEAMPFVPSAATIPVEPKLREHPEVINIAVAATTMKLNPIFMSVLQAIKNQSARPVKFHFFMGFSRGLVYLEVRQFIQNYISDAIINTHLPYVDYIKKMNECDMYLNPFPFGNTNGIVDATSIGLVGVNKTGPEVLEHIDEAMFTRMGMPEWTTAKTHEEYIQAALRLIGDDKERIALRKKIISENAVNVFYKGDGKLFGKELYALVQNL